MSSAAPLAPGARVIIRAAEWTVRRVERSRAGGDQLLCDDVSELVRGREAVFLTTLEDQIEVLDPAETRLVADDSPGIRRQSARDREPAPPGRPRGRPDPSANRGLMPMEAVIRRAAGGVEREEATTAERALLHVAATRAKKRLLVFSYGRSSPFLPKS